jgi:hypothetical protein
MEIEVGKTAVAERNGGNKEEKTPKIIKFI